MLRISGIVAASLVVLAAWLTGCSSSHHFDTSSMAGAGQTSAGSAGRPSTPDAPGGEPGTIDESGGGGSTGGGGTTGEPAEAIWDTNAWDDGSVFAP
jgi:hypothetical protein